MKKKSLRDGRQLVLRGATRADVEAVFELCVRRLAIEHDALDELQTTVEAFARAFAAGKFHLLVAEVDGALAGAAKPHAPRPAAGTNRSKYYTA